MVKLKAFQSHKEEDIPDHILQEIIDLTHQMALSIQPILESECDPNVLLVAMGRLFAGIINHFVSDDDEEKLKAAKLYSANLAYEIMRVHEYKKSLKNDK